MKKLSELTEEEFDILLTNGILHSIYPDAPEAFDQFKGRKPEVLTNPDYRELVNEAQGYINDISEGNVHPDKMSDREVYIYEAAMKAIYGESVFDFINSNID